MIVRSSGSRANGSGHDLIEGGSPPRGMEPIDRVDLDQLDQRNNGEGIGTHGVKKNPRGKEETRQVVGWNKWVPGGHMDFLLVPE